MNDPNRPPNSRDPRPPPGDDDPAKEVAKGAALGCMAGFGAIGAVIGGIVLVVGALVLVGVFLIFLTCSGH